MLFTADTEGQFTSVVNSLKENLKSSKELNSEFLATKEELIAAAKKEGFYKDDEQIQALMERRHLQQKEQFTSVRNKMNKYGKHAIKFVKSDSIGVFTKGIHFIDIALFYENKKATLMKKYVVVFEMTEENGAYRMVDDIYLTDSSGWASNITGKTELYGQ